MYKKEGRPTWTLRFDIHPQPLSGSLVQAPPVPVGGHILHNGAVVVPGSEGALVEDPGGLVARPSAVVGVEGRADEDGGLYPVMSKDLEGKFSASFNI
jgi:hypothetical protein